MCEHVTAQMQMQAARELANLGSDAGQRPPQAGIGHKDLQFTARGHAGRSKSVIKSTKLIQSRRGFGSWVEALLQSTAACAAEPDGLLYPLCTVTTCLGWPGSPGART
jgi:hypothetical protein